ncbi:hypothetical protein LCGC14_1415460 [marine sediment metagenome]|uniref:Uncharacterized protein n=1 Tax=marine sediment metagenome TaxID=412755 RepID=A0A0F9M8H6_9ZZZZ
MLGLIAQAPGTLPPYLEIGAFGLVAAIVLGVLAPLLKTTLATMKDMQKEYTAASAEARTEYTTASQQARDDFRGERLLDRTLTEDQGKQNRRAIGGLARQIERATVASIARSKGVDVEHALEVHEKRNGSERSGETYT